MCEKMDLRFVFGRGGNLGGLIEGKALDIHVYNIYNVFV